MATNGKHLAKNNPEIKGDKAVIIIAKTLLLAFITTLTVKGIAVLNTPPELPKNNNDPSIASTNAGVLPIDAVLHHLKGQYRSIDSYGLTETGLVFEYFQRQMAGLSDEEKIAKMQELINNENLYADVYNFVQSTREIPATEFDLVDVDLNNYRRIVDHEQLMTLVNKYADAYQLNRELVVALLANNLQDGAINFSNPFGLNSFWLGGVESKRTVWNYETQTADNLMTMQTSATANLENAIKYGCAVLANAYKEANGVTDDAIEIFYSGAGPKSVKPRDPNKTSMQYKNEILSIIASSHGDERVKLDYVFTLNEDFIKQMSEIYGHELTFDEICDLTDLIVNQITPHLNNNNVKTK